jgi:hypothetical protein
VPDDVHIHRRSPPGRALIAAIGHALKKKNNNKMSERPETRDPALNIPGDKDTP